MISADDKYSGQNDHFDTKLTIFNEYCSQLNITDEDIKAKAYSHLLKDVALQHYLNNKTAKEQRASATGEPYYMTFKALYKATRDYFENDEYRRSQLQSFNSISLKQVIKENTDKPVKECLLLLVAKLRSLQNGLEPVWREDKILYQRLVTACQGVPACDFACFRPPGDLPGFINSLQSSIETYEKSHPPVMAPAYLTEEDDGDADVYY